MAATRDSFQVLVLGHGEMGRALSQLLRPRHTVSVWERRPQTAAPVMLEGAAARSDFVLFCVPAQPHAELAARLAPVLAPGTVCLSIAKGLDDDGRTAAQVFARCFGERRPYALLYGPMIAEEIRAGRPAFAELGATAHNTAARVKALFAGTALALRETRDIDGMAWSAVLKNVYALLFGISDGLALGDNMRGFLVAAITEEMQRLVTLLGGDAAVPHPLAGLGDLITTATSAGSHHHALGMRLARGEPGPYSGEGVHTVEMVRKFSIFETQMFPLFRLVGAVLRDAASAREMVGEYLGTLTK
jgi:glycerol-3-phosphate dehydrogenase (NAD(P)+)